jgi:4-diphosphocytidyl-2-C-methyl-D-erythritol kinase
MVQTITLSARAKINLTLDVLGKRPDGYHEVAMIMQTVALADLVHLRQADSILIETDDSRLPGDESNLAYRAAALLRRECGVERGVHIRLEKKIPLAAGLAGGSSDAAAVLKGLVQLWELRLTPEDLSRLGASLGSDVPFCLYGGTALATGRGEVITQLRDLPSRPVVLAKPPVDVATASVYKGYRPEAVGVHPDTQSVLTAISQGNWHTIEHSLVNVLESVTVNEHPQIAAIKAMMLGAGATGSLMSGSGPTVFCLAEDDATARQIAQRLTQECTAEVIVTKTSQRELS